MKKNATTPQTRRVRKRRQGIGMDQILRRSRSEGNVHLCRERFTCSCSGKNGQKQCINHHKCINIENLCQGTRLNAGRITVRSTLFSDQQRDLHAKNNSFAIDRFGSSSRRGAGLTRPFAERTTGQYQRPSGGSMRLVTLTSRLGIRRPFLIVVSVQRSPGRNC